MLASAADRTEGMTASFMKELMRRSVLESAVEGIEPDDLHLRRALDGLLAGHEDLTRVLLGNAREWRQHPDGWPEDGMPGGTGWEESGGCGNPFA